MWVQRDLLHLSEQNVSFVTKTSRVKISNWKAIRFSSIENTISAFPHFESVGEHVFAAPVTRIVTKRVE